MSTLKLNLGIQPLDLRSPTAGAPAAAFWPPADMPRAQAPLELMTQAVEYSGYSGVNEVFILHFNAGGVADQPMWSENFEARYVKDAPPAGMLERHWNYRSLDRSVAFRPWTTLFNLNDHRSFEWSLAKCWSIHGYYDDQVSEAIYQFTTGNDALEGQAHFRRPTEITGPSAQLTVADAELGHRATFSVDPSFTHGVLDVRPARYLPGSNVPASFSYVNLSSRRTELVAEATRPAALSFRGNGTDGLSVGFKTVPGAGVLQLVPSGVGADPAGWPFNPSFGQTLAAPTLLVNSGSPDVLGDLAGGVAFGDTETGPASNPVGCGLLFTESGGMVYRGPGGTTTVLAPA